MAITKEKKGEIIAKLKTIFSTSPNVVFVNFHRLAVKQEEELRRAARHVDVRYFVAKKTLIRKALEGQTVVKGELPDLSGEVALAYSSGTDTTAPARELFGFEKKFEKAISLIGGIFEGFFKGREEMVALAMIPPRQTLLAQFVNLLNSSIQRLVIGLSEIAKKKS